MADLTQRLRCRYPSGPIINGEPEFGWRDTSGPMEVILPTPIMKEAADEIDHLALDLQTERAAVVALRAELANARAIDIHSCHDGCTRAGCVAAGLRAEYEHAVEQAAKNADEVVALREEVAGLREDAERWRYMRGIARQKTAYDVYGIGGLWVIGLHSDNNVASLDAVVDAARKAAP